MLATIIPAREFGLAIGPAGAKKTLNHFATRSAGQSPRSARAPADRTSARSRGACARVRISESRPGVGADGAARLQLAVAIFGERALHRRRPAGARRWICNCLLSG